MPPIQVADLAAGALGAVTQILAALLEGGGARITVSMTHGSHDLVAHRVGGEPMPKLLTGGVACYRIYETADGRFLTVGALEPKFWRRLCEVVGLPDLVGRQWEPRLPELEQAIASRPLAEWLELFDGEDVCAGPGGDACRGGREFASERATGAPPRLGEHTDAWRAELGLGGARRTAGGAEARMRARCSVVVSTSTPAPARTIRPCAATAKAVASEAWIPAATSSPAPAPA